MVLLSTDHCGFSCCKLHFMPPAHTLSCACLTHNGAAASNCFLGGGYTLEWMRRLLHLFQPCVLNWKPVCISHVQNATQPRNAVHSPQSLVFPP